MAKTDGYPGQGKISVTASLPSGTSCMIALPPGSRVEQLQPAIERSLKVPQCVQRIVSETGDSELFGHQSLSEAGLRDGACVTVTRAWPADDDAILASLEYLGSTKSQHNELVAVAIAELLDRDSFRIQTAAIQALSWMGPAGASHADKIAGLLCQPTVKRAAAEALSWMGAAGAAYASSIASDCADTHHDSEWRYNVIRDMCWSEDAVVRQAAMKSFEKAIVPHERLMSRIAALMEDACFDPHELVRQSAANAFAGLVCAIDDRLGWGSGPGEILARTLCTFGSKVLEGKSCPISAFEVKAACAPLTKAITSASREDTPSARQKVEFEIDCAMELETKRVKRVCYQVRVATIRLFGRLWGPDERGLYISFVCTLGVQNKSSQVRQASVEWLTEIHPHGACGAMNVAKLLKSDRKQKVVAAVNRFFEAYADSIEISSSGALNTDVRQEATGEAYDSDWYDSEPWSEDEALDWEDDWDAHHAHTKLSKGHASTSTPKKENKEATRKAAALKEEATAKDHEHAENEKRRDARRHAARDSKEGK